MTIFITNSAYIAKSDLADCLPIIAWQSTLQLTDITASGAEGSRVASNLWAPDTATFWQAQATGAASITLANTGAKSIDYVAIAKHNLGSVGISYALFTSEDGTTFTALGASKTVSSDSPIVDYFDAITSPYIQIQFTGGIPIIAHVRMGVALVLQRSIYVGHTPATLGKIVSRQTQTSSVGQYLGQVVLQSSYKTALTQENITPDFMRTYIAPLIAHINGSKVDDGTARGTFFFAWRPIDYSNEIIYAWSEDSVQPQNQRSNGMMNFTLNMMGVA